MRIFGFKRRAALLSLALATGLVATAIVHAAVSFGPSRPTYTWANPADHITFNSITDNPVWGDERFLVKARDVNSGSNTYTTNMKVTDNEELLVTVYFHNDAASNLNLTAHNTRAKIALPSGANSSLETKANISADNSNPTDVWSTMDFTSSNGQPFTVEYVSGSARLITNYINTSLSDNVVGSGTLIGTSAANGDVPGCAQFSGYVTIHVRVHVPTPPPQSSFACSMLDVVKVDRTRFDFTAHATAQNVNVTSYDFSATNSKGAVVDTFHTDTNALSTLYHFNQSAADTYIVRATVNTDHGSNTSDTCVKQVVVEAAPQVLPATTPPPAPAVGKTLPNTGPGGVVGLFGGATALGTAGHYLVRRFRR